MHAIQMVRDSLAVPVLNAVKDVHAGVLGAGHG